MRENSMQSHIGAAFSLMAVCTCLHFLHAEENCIEQKECNVFSCVEIDTCCGPPPGYNAPAWFDFECKKHVAAFWVDFLYWVPKQEFMEIAFTSPHAIRNSMCGISSTGSTVVDIGSNLNSTGHMQNSNNFRP